MFRFGLKRQYWYPTSSSPRQFSVSLIFYLNWAQTNHARRCRYICFEFLWVIQNISSIQGCVWVYVIFARYVPYTHLVRTEIDTIVFCLEMVSFRGICCLPFQSFPPVLKGFALSTAVVLIESGCSHC